jgi:glutaredoxin
VLDQKLSVAYSIPGRDPAHNGPVVSRVLFPDHSADHRVTLITRRDCHLCEAAETTLRRLRDELGFGYAEVDVDGAADVRAEYSDRVPVVLIDGREHGYWRVEEPRFRKALRKPVRG